MNKSDITRLRSSLYNQAMEHMDATTAVMGTGITDEEQILICDTASSLVYDSFVNLNISLETIDDDMIYNLTKVMAASLYSGLCDSWKKEILLSALELAGPENIL